MVSNTNICNFQISDRYFQHIFQMSVNLVTQTILTNMSMFKSPEFHVKPEISLEFQFFRQMKFRSIFFSRAVFFVHNQIQFFRETSSSQISLKRNKLLPNLVFFCETIFFKIFIKRNHGTFTTKFESQTAAAETRSISLRSNLRLNFAAVKQTAILLAQPKKRVHVLSAQLLSLYENACAHWKIFPKRLRILQ